MVDRSAVEVEAKKWVNAWGLTIDLNVELNQRALIIATRSSGESLFEPFEVYWELDCPNRCRTVAVLGHSWRRGEHGEHH
jgi:hypothetical protein